MQRESTGKEKFEQEESIKYEEKRKEREEKLKLIKSQINKDVEATFNVIKTSPINKLRKVIRDYMILLVESLNKNSKRVLFLLLTTFPLFVFTLTIFQVKTTDKELIANEEIVDASTLIELNMNKKDYQLEVDIKTLAINNDIESIQIDNTNWLESDMKLDINKYELDGKPFNISSKLEISKLKINNNLVYIQSLNNNNTASKEIIFGYNKADIHNKESLLENLFQKESYNNSYLLLRESISGGKLTQNDLQNITKEYERTAKYSKNQSDIVIRFVGLGDLNLNKLQGTDRCPEVNYLKHEGILRISYNNMDYIYISGINNKKIGCNAEDLLSTNKDNILVHKEFNNSEENGYRTMAIKSSNNIYVIRINKNVEDNILEKLLIQLNIDYDKLEIDSIQEVILK